MGFLDGGYGQTIASYLGDSDLNIQNYGLEKAFHDRFEATELLADSGLTTDHIVRKILAKI
ncbi:hypothetical protein ID741_002666 [Enterococcus sp. AZ103]